MSRVFPIACCALAAGLSSCDGASLEPTGATEVLVTLDAGTYQAGVRPDATLQPSFAFEVEGTISNTGEESVYLVRCYPTSNGPFVVVRSVEGPSTYEAPEVCVETNSKIRLNPGEARTDVFSFTGPVFRDPQIEHTGEGLFRLEYKVEPCSTGRCLPLPGQETSSTPFQVHVR